MFHPQNFLQQQVASQISDFSMNIDGDFGSQQRINVF